MVLIVLDDHEGDCTFWISGVLNQIYISLVNIWTFGCTSPFSWPDLNLTKMQTALLVHTCIVGSIEGFPERTVSLHYASVALQSSSTHLRLPSPMSAALSLKGAQRCCIQYPSWRNWMRPPCCFLKLTDSHGHLKPSWIWLNKTGKES